MGKDTQYEIGTEVLSFCGRCKLPLTHTIVSITKKGTVDRCECKTCGAVHKYRDPKKVKGASAPKKASPQEVWKKAMADPKAPPKPYIMAAEFNAEDIIDHPSFGKGFVVELIEPNKLRVVFESGEKVLIHKR
jgi:hypothetical protein